MPPAVEKYERAGPLLDLVVAAGVPVPRWEAVVPLADGTVALLQERARGRPIAEVTPRLVDAMLDLADRRRELLRGSTAGYGPMPLFLTSDGPGYCLHEPVRRAGGRPAELLEVIEDIGLGCGVDALPGTDVVHADYHVGNVLVVDADPGAVAAVIDWNDVRAGDVAMDLAVLAYDLTWRSPGALAERVVDHLHRTTDERTARLVWAHVSLRLLDWTFRHFPADLDHWVAVVDRHLASP